MNAKATRYAGLLALPLLFTIGCRRTAPSLPQRSPATSPSPSVTSPRAAATPATRILHVEPDAGFSWLYTLVEGAHQSIDMTMYELVDPTATSDLLAACGRGVRVRVILDGGLERSRNTPAYSQLNGAGANCAAAWSNPQFQATHEKSLVIDAATAVILTANLTSRYYATTRDFALVEGDASDIAAIEATFNTDYDSSTDFSYQPGDGKDLIWSPTSAQAALLRIIHSAKKTLVVENEEMGDAAIVEAFEAACKRGVAVRIAMTDTSAAYHANYLALEQAGCLVHIGANNATTLYIHAKTVVVDLGTRTQAGYLGSINFSKASLTENRELGLRLTDAATLNQLNSTVTKDFDLFPAFQ